jgi:hypothetical protein
VTSEPAGIECGPICESPFYYGPASDYWKTRVTLTATPAPGSEFVGWSGEGCSGLGPCKLAIEDPSAEVDAEFEAVPSLLASTQSSSSSSAASTTATPTQSGQPHRHKARKCAKKGKKGKKKASRSAKRRHSARCAKR